MDFKDLKKNEGPGGLDWSDFYFQTAMGETEVGKESSSEETGRPVL